MNNIKRVLPIRNYQIKNPLFVAFNIHLTHYNGFGTENYNRIKNVLTKKEYAGLNYDSVYLLPNITNLDTSIDQRAESLSKNINKLLQKIGASKCHLVAHSFTGIDARAAISMFDSYKQVQSLTTICTPHLGMKLVDLSLKDGENIHFVENIDRTYELLGITGEASKEFTTHNIAAFNNVCPNSEHVDYYSIGAKKQGKIMNTMLRNGYDILIGEKWGDQCDGFVRDVEARWGKYLITFENDHFEVMGFEPGHNPANVFNLVADNVRICDIKNDPKLKYEYGLDHL